MVKGRQGDARTNTEMLRLAGHVHAHEMHRGTDTIIRKVVLGQPHGIVARFIHDGDALQSPLVDGRQRHALLWPAEKLQNTEFHGARFLYEGRVVCC
jgi:hypothetical protein